MIPSTKRKQFSAIGRSQGADDEAALTDAIVRLATRYGRYGYQRIREMLLAEGWRVNVKRVFRIGGGKG